MRRTMILLALLGFLGFVYPVASARAAMDLADVKAQGLVGERPDGLVGIVSPPGSPELRAMVEGINAGRLETYRDISAKQGTPLTQVQSVAGQSLISKTLSGQYVLSADGVWKKAP